MSRKTAATLGEIRIIKLLRSVVTTDAKDNLTDDCAILEYDKDNYLIASIDASYDVQDFPHFATPYEKAWQVVACSLSDIAAMGGTPIGILDSLEIPSNMSEGELKRLFRGLNEAARRFGTQVIGGDINGSDRLGVTVAVLGKVRKDEAMMRSTAKNGDVLGIVGFLGDYNAAYMAFKKGLELTGPEKRHFLDAMLKLRPQISEGKALARTRSVTSCIDLNDGLYRGLYEITECSGVGLDIYEDRLPISPYARKVADRLKLPPSGIAINFAGDLNLLLTCRDEDRELVSDAVKYSGNNFYEIGRVNGYRGRISMDGKALCPSSFEHFKTTDLFDLAGWEKFQR